MKLNIKYRLKPFELICFWNAIYNELLYVYFQWILVYSVDFKILTVAEFHEEVDLFEWWDLLGDDLLLELDGLELVVDFPLEFVVLVAEGEAVTTACDCLWVCSMIWWIKSSCCLVKPSLLPPLPIWKHIRKNKLFMEIWNWNV